jgi:hypothetical protein
LDANVNDVQTIFESVSVEELRNFVGDKVNFSKRRVLSYQLLEWERVYDSEVSSDVVNICISWIASQKSKGFSFINCLNVKWKSFFIVFSLKFWL